MITDLFRKKMKNFLKWHNHKMAKETFMVNLHQKNPQVHRAD